jgi:hypothetical protein
MAVNLLDQIVRAHSAERRSSIAYILLSARATVTRPMFAARGSDGGDHHYHFATGPAAPSCHDRSGDNATKQRQNLAARIIVVAASLATLGGGWPVIRQNLPAAAVRALDRGYLELSCGV